MSKSVISDEPACIVCGQTQNLHRHHIFFGIGNRKLSEKHGCWCYLCARHHNMSDHGVHFDSTLNLKIQRMCQKILENKHGWSREKFIETFGRNYID